MLLDGLEPDQHSVVENLLRASLVHRLDIEDRGKVIVPERDFRDIKLSLTLGIPGGTEEMVGAPRIRTLAGFFPVLGKFPVRHFFSFGRFEDDGRDGVDDLGMEQILGRMSGTVDHHLQGIPDDAGVMVRQIHAESVGSLGNFRPFRGELPVTEIGV